MATIKNSANIKTQGVAYYNGLGVFSGIDGSAPGNVLTSNGTGIEPSFQAPTALFLWIPEAINFSATVNNGYICTAALTATLPSSPANGDFVNIIVDTTGTVIIQAAATQFIRIASTISSSAGTATSTARGNTVSLTYNSSDATWLAFSFVTTWNLA